MLLNSHRFALVGGGNPELLADPGWDTPTAWTIPTGMTISGSKLNISTTGGQDFVTLENPDAGDRTPITAGVLHNWQMVIDSVTTAGRMRISIDQFTTAFNVSGGLGARISLWDTNTDGTLSVQTMAKSFTPVAGTLSVSLVVEATTGPVVATSTSVSIKAA